MQAMPSAGYLPDLWPSSSNALYASKHNPFILYNDVRLNPARAAHIKPYTSMAADLNGPNPPRYVWISPDECSDMHGGIYTAVAWLPRDPCPYSDVRRRRQRPGAEGQGRRIRQERGPDDHAQPGLDREQRIFVIADETDFDGTNPTDNDYASTEGCCDSPNLPAGDPRSAPAGLAAYTAAARRR